MYQLELGNCIYKMQGIADNSVDLVVADPPYGETSLDWDKHVHGWLEEVKRVLKPSGSLWVFGSMRFFMDRASDFISWNFAQDVLWEKHNGTNAFNDRFRRVHEHAGHFYLGSWKDIYKQPLYTHDARAKTVRRKKRTPHWRGADIIDESSYVSVDGGPKLMRSVMFCRSMHGTAQHPTQKPVDIITPLIEYSCPEYGVVLDPFMGSGTTGVACAQLRRLFVGIELNPKYFEIARNRVEVAYGT